MTVTSIGSSFSFIRPEAAARETAASSGAEEASESKASRDDQSGSESTTAADIRKASLSEPAPSATPAVHTELVRTQETKSAPPAHAVVARAYARA